jgi:hypothetical protein
MFHRLVNRRKISVTEIVCAHPPEDPLLAENERLNRQIVGQCQLIAALTTENECLRRLAKVAE